MVWLAVLYAVLGLTVIHADPPFGFRGGSAATARLLHLLAFLYLGRVWPWPFYQPQILSSIEELGDQRHIRRLRRVLRSPFFLRPGIELGAADQVEHPRPAPRRIPFGALLVERVQVEQGLVGRTLLQGLHIGLRLGELFVEGHVSKSSVVMAMLPFKDM